MGARFGDTASGGRKVKKFRLRPREGQGRDELSKVVSPCENDGGYERDIQARFTDIWMSEDWNNILMVRRISIIY